jgi:hypothetical protein
MEFGSFCISGLRVEDLSRVLMYNMILLEVWSD